MKKAVIYSRVSTDEQANEGKSIEVQIDICHKWAKENQHSVVGVYPEPGKSATTLKGRVALQEAIAQSQLEKIDVLLVMDTDRLARNPSDHYLIKSALEKGGTRIVAVNQPMIDDSVEGNFMETIMAGVNQFQSQITGRKVKKSLEKKCNDGDWPGWAPLGYINVNKGTEDKPIRIVEIDPERGKYLSLLFKLFSTEKYSVDELRDLLYDKGLRSKYGKMVARSSLYGYLKNPFYIGQFKFKGMIFKGSHPPLTSRAVFDLCQKIIERNNHNACRRRKYKWLLTGIAYCYDCGSRFYCSHNHKKKMAYYHGAYPLGCKEYIPLEELENQVANEIKKIKFSEEFKQRIYEKAKELILQTRENRNEELQSIRNKVKGLESRRNVLEDNLLDQTIDKETFKRKHEEINYEIQNLENDMATIENNRGFDLDLVTEVLD
ncbi:MAG: hypothetical protein UV17_C0020G0017 [Candidatus Gottesmanbacteria bacterium GW2011_GWA1_42_26]|nr:MAG: hypothetical protein UV17_C0020G0017 [Candidatus Gottesmanbacteria bacterium GW2011_GWA1_42_26]